MLTVKQNFLETIKKTGNPDRLVKQFEAMADICAAIGAYRHNCFKLMADFVKPDIVI